MNLLSTNHSNNDTFETFAEEKHNVNTLSTLLTTSNDNQLLSTTAIASNSDQSWISFDNPTPITQMFNFESYCQRDKNQLPKLLSTHSSCKDVIIPDVPKVSFSLCETIITESEQKMSEYYPCKNNADLTAIMIGYGDGKKVNRSTQRSWVKYASQRDQEAKLNETEQMTSNWDAIEKNFKNMGLKLQFYLFHMREEVNEDWNECVMYVFAYKNIITCIFFDKQQ